MCWPASASTPCAEALKRVAHGSLSRPQAASLRLLIALLAAYTGWVTNFLSHAQVSGFMTGAAILIGLSQVRSCRRHLCLEPLLCANCPLACLPAAFALPADSARHFQ